MPSINQEQFNVGDLVRVIGANGVLNRAGIAWTPKKNSAVGSVYEVATVKMVRDHNYTGGDILLYTLKAHDDGEPPANPTGKPYSWFDNWLELVQPVDLTPEVSDEDFELIFV